MKRLWIAISIFLIVFGCTGDICPSDYSMVKDDNNRVRCYYHYGMECRIFDVNCSSYGKDEVDCPNACVEIYKIT